MRSVFFKCYLDLTLNNQQGLICHKNQPTNQTSVNFDIVLHYVPDGVFK